MGRNLQSIEIPVPPSANRIWRVIRGGRVIKSKEYRDWLSFACLLIRANLKPVTLPVSVRITITGGRGRWDLDNRIKPTLDALKHANIIADDDVRHVVKIEARFMPMPGTPVLLLEVREV